MDDLDRGGVDPIGTAPVQAMADILVGRPLRRDEATLYFDPETVQ